MEHTKGPWTIKGQDIYGNEANGYICTWSGRTADAELIAQAPAMYDRLASARAIMQKFVDKVDRGVFKTRVTYAEMKQWMEDE